MSDTPVKKRKMSLTQDAPPPVSELRIKRLSDKARLPTRGSASAAGYDLSRYASTAFHYILDNIVDSFDIIVLSR